MIDFTHHDNCDHPKCKLRESATCPGIPSRQWPKPAEPRLLPCVFIVGEAPGYHEDLRRECWVGVSGKLLQNFIVASNLLKFADVYLGNACRCRPPQHGNPTDTQGKYCRPYLLEDLKKLTSQYQLVVVFAQGAKAAKTLTGLSLRDSLVCQQEQIDLPGRPWYFVTSHPANLLSGRKPQLIHSVRLHWQLLADFLANPHHVQETRPPLSYTRAPSPPT